MKALNIALCMLLASIVAAHVAIGDDPGLPKKDYLPQMAYSEAAETYAASPLFPDGRVLQAAPPGTVARHAGLSIFEPTPAGAARAGDELVAPAVTEPGKKRGADLYATFCTPCHGAAGAGDGAVVKRGFPAPPSLLAARAAGMKDGQIFHIVTYGQANMPGYASQIDEEDRWRVVAHVREMQRSRQ